MDEQNKITLGEFYKELTSEETKGNYSIDYNTDEPTAKANFTNMIGMISRLDTETVTQENSKYLRQAILMNVADTYLTRDGGGKYTELEQMSKSGDIEFAARFLSTLLKQKPGFLKDFVNNDLVQNWLEANGVQSRDMTSLAKEALETEPELGEVADAGKAIETPELTNNQKVNEGAEK